LDRILFREGVAEAWRFPPIIEVSPYSEQLQQIFPVFYPQGFANGSPQCDGLFKLSVACRLVSRLERVRGKKKPQLLGKLSRTWDPTIKRHGRS